MTLRRPFVGHIPAFLGRKGGLEDAAGDLARRLSDGMFGEGVEVPREVTLAGNIWNAGEGIADAASVRVSSRSGGAADGDHWNTMKRQRSGHRYGPGSHRRQFETRVAVCTPRSTAEGTLRGGRVERVTVQWSGVTVTEVTKVYRNTAL